MKRLVQWVAVVALVATPLVAGAIVTPAGASGSVSVSTASGLATAWKDNTNTHITLTANVTIANGDCALDGYPRDAGGSGIVVDGQGLFGITSTCELGRILLDDGSSEAVTLTGLTHFDGGKSCDVGGGIAVDGPVTATDSSFASDSASGACPCGTAVATCSAGSAGFVHGDPVLPQWIGGAIFSSSSVTLDHSTFTGNHADIAGGAVYALGDVVSTGSTFTDNSAGQSGELMEYLWGGAIAGESAITVDASTFTGNFIGDSKGTCAVCIIAGGAIAQTTGLVQSASSSPPVTITNSTFGDNHADCAYYCLTQGGAVVADLLTTSGSTFTGNHSDAAGCAQLQCWNEGGAIAARDLTLSGSTVSDNTANCDTNCAAYGGGIVAGQSLGAGNAGAAAAGGFKGADGPHPIDVFAQPVGGAVSISQSVVSGNSATCDTTECGVSGGGALLVEPTTVDITASTFSANVAQYGGAVEVFSGDSELPVTITNSTVTGNTTTFDGALGLDDSNVTTTLAYDTIVGNVVGEIPAGALSAGSWSELRGRGVQAAVVDRPANLSALTLTSFGTIVALPQGGPNCVNDESATVTSQGYNWTDDTSCFPTPAATDKVATPNDPGLNALGDWGGPTHTMLPLTPLHGGTTSPVIDAIPISACQTGVAAGVTTDQRGITRPQLLGCDIGAVEVQLSEYAILPAEVILQPKFTG